MDYYYKKSGTIFNAHSYWTKQPVEVIKSFILDNTSKGDIVLDPFCGSGMTGVAAIETNRRFILSDISPVCIHIAKGYCNKFNEEEVESYLKMIRDKMSYLYYSKCEECEHSFEIDYSILEENLENQKSINLKTVVGKCACCNKKIRKMPDELDLKLHDSHEFEKFYYPKDYFFGNEPKRNYKKGIFQVYQLYSNRNLSALSILLSEIEKIGNLEVKQLFLFGFSSILFNCSLMSRYNPKYENTQIKMGSYYVPKLIKENNVLLSFERKIKAIIKAKNEIFKENEIYDGSIILQDASQLDKINSNSIDYIYTDPPYSDKISYSELNLVYESWLRNGRTDTSKEMIVSKASGKSIEFYSNLFSKFMKECIRVLKPNKKLTIIFHNSSLEHWSYFQEVVNVDGLRPLISQVPDRLISASKTSTQYQTDNDSQCFLAFSFIKDNDYKKKNYSTLSDKQYSEMILKIKEEAVQLGYCSKADIFDFTINRLLFSTKIKNTEN